MAEVNRLIILFHIYHIFHLAYILHYLSYNIYLAIHKDTIKRAKYKRKALFSFYSRAIVSSTKSIIRLSERNTKGKLSFLFIPER